MMSSDGRPIYLDLRKIRLPVPGIISIMHRVFGVLLSLSIPLFSYVFALSLRDEAGFAQALDILTAWWLAPLYLVLLWGLVHHLFAGIRYLLIDVEIGVEKSDSIKSARIVLWAGVVVAILLALGVWL